MSAAASLRINTIHLENFRSCRDFALAFDELRTLLIGENGAGKSTVIDAISWCLRARCRGVDGKGAGQRELIGDQGDTMTVTLDLDGIGPLRRTYDRAGNTTVTMKDPLAKLQTNDATLAAVLYGRTFFQLHHADAKQLLFQVLDVRVDPKLLPALKLKQPATLDELDAYYQAAFQNRAAAKKTLLALHVPDVAKVVDIAATNEDGLTKELAQLQTTYQDAVMEQSGKAAEHQRLTRQLADIQAALVNRDQVMGNLQTHSDSHTNAQIDLSTAQKTLAAAEDQTAEPVRELQTQVADLQLLVKRLESHDPERGCVLAATIPCLTKAKDFAGHIKKIAADTKALEKRIKAGAERQQQIGAAQQQVRDAERHITYHAAQIEDCNRKLKAHDDALGEQDSVAERHRVLTQDVQALADKVTQATRDMDDRRQLLQTAYRYNADLKTRAAALTKQQELQAELKDLEAKVDQLGPNGVRLQALTGAVADFEQAINAALVHFGFELRLQAEPWTVQMKKADGPWRPFELLSDGEKLWTGLSFQMALALQSGLDFCCIDAAETVVGQRRQLLTALLMAAPVGQIIVAMAKGEHDPDPVVEGLQVVRIHGTTADLTTA